MDLELAHRVDRQREFGRLTILIRSIAFSAGLFACADALADVVWPCSELSREGSRRIVLEDLNLGATTDLTIAGNLIRQLNGFFGEVDPQLRPSKVVNCWANRIQLRNLAPVTEGDFGESRLEDFRRGGVIAYMWGGPPADGEFQVEFAVVPRMLDPNTNGDLLSFIIPAQITGKILQRRNAVMRALQDSKLLPLVGTLGQINEMLFRLTITGNGRLDDINPSTKKCWTDHLAKGLVWAKSTLRDSTLVSSDQQSISEWIASLTARVRRRASESPPGTCVDAGTW